MSLILDALKKSENDRKRNSNPMIADVRVANESPAAPTWLWWLIGLLAINLLVLLVVILRPAKATPESTASPGDVTREAPLITNVDSATALEPYAPVMREPIRAKEEVRSLSREVAISEEGLSREDPNRTRPVSASPVPESVPAKPAARVSAAPADLADPAMPRYEELVANGSLDVPQLHIDLHFYHPEAQRRLIYINSQKYGEGETTKEGPVISDIRPDGATLNYRGTDFFLSRD